VSDLPSPPSSLAQLEIALRSLSHDDLALKLIQAFAQSLGKTKQRQAVFNAPAALIQMPITFDDALQEGIISAQADPFSLLQGDIISSDAAYLMGERLIGMKFAIASSTCDLVPERRQFATLLRIQPIRAQDPHTKALLGELLSFRSTQRMYLPPLPGDSDDTIANSILIDGLVQVRLSDLLLATRHASLSLVGWRIFGSLLRSILVRAGEEETLLRSLQKPNTTTSSDA
jgi:hypothetical protein